MMDIHQIWEITLSRLQERLPPSTFASWFSKTTALAFHDKIFVVGVPTTGTKAHLEAHSLESIRTTVSEVVGSALEVQLVVSPEQFIAHHKLSECLTPITQQAHWGKFLLLIAQEESHYRASIPDIPGCVAVGKTREEAIYAVREAFQAYLAMVYHDQGTFPEPHATAEYLLLPLAQSQEEGQSCTQPDSFCSLERIAHCSFCGTPHDQSSGFTRGPAGLSICHACVQYCQEMILEQGTIDFQRLREALASHKHQRLP